MLGGGYYRGASVLITGFPGTAKTTLSGAFAEAPAARGERTMFVSFDSDGDEVIRNLASVGIRLDRYVRAGCLRMISARTITGSAETYLVRIKTLAREHRARCLVIDPVSTLSKIRQRADRAQRGGTADRLVEGRRHHAGLHQPARRDVEPDGRRLAAADLDARRHLDPPQLPGAGRRAQPRHVHHQVARHGAFEPGARADPERCGRDADRHLHRRRRSADGHAALGKGSRGKIPHVAAGTECYAKRRELQFAEADTAARITALRLISRGRVRPRPQLARRCSAGTFRPANGRPECAG